MRRALLLLLTYIATLMLAMACILVPAPAQGQTPYAGLVDACTGNPALPPVFIYIDYQASTGALRCDSATTVTVKSNLAGITGWRYCKRPDGSFAPQWAAASWAGLAGKPEMVADVAATLAREGFQPSTATLQQLAQRYAVTPLAQPEVAKAWCPYWQEIWRGIPASAPAPTAGWQVARFGSLATRPAFLVSNGKRGAQSPTRAPVTTGAPPAPVACDCAAPIVEGLSTYCPWTQSGGLITLCTKVTP